MAHTIFILGTDPQQCKQLREILKDRVSDEIVTASGDRLPGIQDSDTVIITSEEKNTGVLYRLLLSRLEEEVHRAQFLSELIRLFSSSHRIDEILDRVVNKSSEMLGDTAFIALADDAGKLKLEAASSTDTNKLTRLLMAIINLAPEGLNAGLLKDVLDERQPRLIEQLQQLDLPPELRPLLERFQTSSLLAVPIQTKDYVLGAFISTCTAPMVFTQEHVRIATELSDFTAIALENAGLFAELQKSAITDPLTGLYNTRFFNEVLAREAARTERYLTPLSLLMLDVDSFKLVNDTYGHVVGNKVLSQLAKVLQKSVRNTDLAFRCGGDEFGIILPVTNMDGALHAAEKILSRVEQAGLLTALGYSGPLTVSIGISEYRRGNHYETMVAEADQALYASKRSSRNCARAFGAT